MRRTLAILAASLFLLGACSSGSDAGFTPSGRIALSDGSEAVDRGEARSEGGAITIRMGEFYFEPTVVIAPAGSRLRITLENVGENVHDFELAERGIDVTFAEGEGDGVTIDVPDAGQALTFECKFHLPEAMRGEIRAG